MNDAKTFAPGGSGFTISVSGGSSNDDPLQGSGDFLRIVNRTGNLVYVKTGVGTQTATDADFFVPPDTISYLRISFSDDTVAVLMASGGSTTVALARGTAS